MELLGTRESVAFSELRAETGLPVGTLYYHLDVLQGLVVQDSDRRYKLSKEGLRLYAEMAAKDGLPVPSSYRPARFLPGWLFVTLQMRTPLAFASWTAIAAVGGALSHYAGEVLILFHFGVSVFPDWQDVILFPVSMVIYAAYNLGFSWLTSRRGTDVGGFLSSGMVFLPYLIFPTVAITLSSLPLPSLRLALLVVAVVIQALSLTLGATYVSSVYGMKLERSLLLQLAYYVLATLAFSSLQYTGMVAEAWRT